MEAGEAVPMNPQQQRALAVVEAGALIAKISANVRGLALAATIAILEERGSRNATRTETEAAVAEAGAAEAIEEETVRQEEAAAGAQAETTDLEAAGAPAEVAVETAREAGAVAAVEIAEVIEMIEATAVASEEDVEEAVEVAAEVIVEAAEAISEVVVEEETEAAGAVAEVDTTEAPAAMEAAGAEVAVEEALAAGVRTLAVAVAVVVQEDGALVAQQTRAILAEVEAGAATTPLEEVAAQADGAILEQLQQHLNLPGARAQAAEQVEPTTSGVRVALALLRTHGAQEQEQAAATPQLRVHPKAARAAGARRAAIPLRAKEARAGAQATRRKEVGD